MTGHSSPLPSATGSQSIGSPCSLHRERRLGREILPPSRFSSISGGWCWGASTLLPCRHQTKKCLRSQRLHAPKTPGHASQASLEHRWRGAVALGVCWGGGAGPKPRGWHLPGPGSQWQGAHRHIPPPRLLSDAGGELGSKAGWGDPTRDQLRPGRAAGGWVFPRLDSNLVNQVMESRLLPSIPPSIPIQAQQSPWVM